MSRLGRRPIEIPAGVKVTVSDHKVAVTGSKGAIERQFNPRVKIMVDEAGKKLSVTREGNTKLDKAVHGTERSLLNNMIIGVTTGYEKRLEIHGVGYGAKQQGNELVIQIGYTHPVKMEIPKGINITTPNPNLVVMQSVNKELLGNFAAKVREIKPCDPYQIKGIKYSDEVIRKKAGKTFVSGAK
jgi:large subunit ribosomal protein L6